MVYTRSMLGSGAVRPLLARRSAANVLCELSGTAEMVVVGSRGRGGVAGLKLGSVAWQVAVHGHGPVVMVRGQWHVAGHASGPVAVGVDGSSASQAAIAFAFGEEALHGVPLLAVCALADEPGTLGGAPGMEAGFSHAMTACEKELPDVTVLRQVAQGAPRTALLAAAAGAQLLVVGCRGRGGVPGMNLDRGRDRPCGRPPAQIPACAANALGSCLGCERRSARQGRDAGCGLAGATASRDGSSGPSSGGGAGCGSAEPRTSAGSPVSGRT